jgi:hypothetical protein
MAKRYKLLSGDKSFSYKGDNIVAGSDGWLHPTSTAMELAIIEAGAVPAGIVVAENLAGAPVPATITTTDATQNPITPPASSSGSGGSSSSGVQAVAASGATPISLATAPNVLLTLAAAVTLSFTSLPALNNAQRVVLTIVNGAAGITWPTGIRWAGAGVVGSAPTLSTGTDKVVIDITNNGGTITYDGSYVGRVA